MAMNDSVRKKLDELLQAEMINVREYRNYELYISNRSPFEFKDLVLNTIKMDVGHMLNGEMIKRTDKLLLAAAKFYWEQALVFFEKSIFISHENVLDGVKVLLESLERSANLEISVIFEPEILKIVTDFYSHGCLKTDKISIALKNMYLDPRFDYVANWLQENGVKITSNWNEFSIDAQGTMVIIGGWHDFLNTKEFSERIYHLITKKIPVIVLKKVECLSNEQGILNLSDVVQVSLFEDRQLILTNGDELTVKPFGQIKSMSRFPYDSIAQSSHFILLT